MGYVPPPKPTALEELYRTYSAAQMIVLPPPDPRLIDGEAPPDFGQQYLTRGWAPKERPAVDYGDLMGWGAVLTAAIGLLFIAAVILGAI